MRSLALSKYAVGFRRTLDHLRAWPIQLPPQLKETLISFHTNEKGHSGLRLFIYQHLPQLKYHNPNVLFKVIRNQNPPQCSIQFVYNEDTDQINVKDLEASDIKAKIQQLTSTSTI